MAGFLPAVVWTSFRLRRRWQVLAAPLDVGRADEHAFPGALPWLVQPGCRGSRSAGSLPGPLLTVPHVAEEALRGLPRGCSRTTILESLSEKVGGQTSVQ